MQQAGGRGPLRERREGEQLKTEKRRDDGKGGDGGAAAAGLLYKAARGGAKHGSFEGWEGVYVRRYGVARVGPPPHREREREREVFGHWLCLVLISLSFSLARAHMWSSVAGRR